MANYDTIPRMIIVPQKPDTTTQIKTKIQSLPSTVFSLPFATLLIRCAMVITLMHVLHVAYLPQIRLHDILGPAAADSTASMFSGISGTLSNI